MSVAHAGTTGRSVMTLARYFGALREACPIHCQVRIQKAWGSIFTCPDEVWPCNCPVWPGNRQLRIAGPGVTDSDGCAVKPGVPLLHDWLQRSAFAGKAPSAWQVGQRTRIRARGSSSVAPSVATACA